MADSGFHLLYIIVARCACLVNVSTQEVDMGYTKLMEIINYYVSLIGGIFLAIMTSITFAQVIARYVFYNAMAWPEELGQFLFVWIAYLGCCKNMHEDAHLKVEAFIMIFNDRTQHIFKIITLVITILFCVLIIYNGTYMAIEVSESGQQAMTMPIPLVLVWFVIPVCFAITALQGVMLIMKHIDALKRSR